MDATKSEYAIQAPEIALNQILLMESHAMTPTSALSMTHVVLESVLDPILLSAMAQ
jgi:hypothetical protein